MLRMNVLRTVAGSDQPASVASRWRPLSVRVAGCALVSVAVAGAVLFPASAARASFMPRDLLSVSVADSDHAWAVGDAGELLRTADGGAIWTEQSIDTSVDLRSVQFINANDGWAVGSTFDSGSHAWDGVVFSTVDGGSSWSPHTLGLSSVDITGMFFVDADHGWIVGQETGSFLQDTDVILSTADGGASWVLRYRSSYAYYGYGLEDVFFSDLNHGWAVGHTDASHPSAILHTDDGGEHWITQLEVTDYAELHSVHFVDGVRGWAVGGNSATSTVLATMDGGAHWQRQSPVRGTFNLTSVFFVDSLRGWAVDQSGVILRTSDGGAHWVLSWSGEGFDTGVELSAVVFADPLHGYAVGDRGHGVVLTTGDGGLTWAQRVPAPIKATVGTPIAPSRMRHSRAYSVYGFIKPRHASGIRVVTLMFYKRNTKGAYVYHHSVSAKSYYHSASMSEYKASVSLPHSGRWRVRAYHADTEHTESYSGYDYITVS